VLPAADLERESFDLVTSWAVFEHLHTPLEYFRTVAEVLRAGGKFVFLVTNAESFYGKYAYAEDVPRHLYHFSEKTLGQYASKCGLTLDRVHYDDRLWDGRGFGTFRYGLGKLVGARWEQVRLKRLNLAQRAAMKIGGVDDRLVFSNHWEAKLRSSGIIVAVMSK
jgi:SAM-dependent methyltransferase